MKLLAENGLQHSPSCISIIQYSKKLGDAAVINDIGQIAKALNEFKPNILILREENITDVIRAYRDKYNLKIIAYGSTYPECPYADLTLQTNLDYPLTNLDVLTYREDVEKTDVSVFVNDPIFAFLAEFLAKNYNVKVYGSVKINSPKYLGHTTDVEKYEILNKSKQSIVFNLVDMHESITLGAYPIAYSTSKLDTIKTFDNMISLMSCMEFVSDELHNSKLIEDLLSDLQNKQLEHNSLTFVIDTLQTLGFKEEANKLLLTLEEIKKEKMNDWVLS